MFETSTDAVVGIRSAMDLPVNKLLATLPAEDFELILGTLTVVPLRFKQVLYKQDAKIEYGYFPGGGACSLTKVMQDGELPRSRQSATRV